MTTYLPTVIERAPLTLAIRDALRGAGLSAEVAKPPTPQAGHPAPAMPYCIVYPLGMPTLGPPLTTPDSRAVFRYQITSVGESALQVDGMADHVRSILVGRSSSGAFATALAPPALTVVERWTEGADAMQWVEGVMSLPEVYRFAAQAS